MMADDGPRRQISVPIKGDRWRHQTVQGHIAHPPRQDRFRNVHGHTSRPVIPQSQTLQQTYQCETIHDHISTPITSRSQTLRQTYKSRTVHDHISTPVTSPFQTLQQTYKSQTVRGHISTPVATRPQTLQQRKRHRHSSIDSPHYTVAQSGRSQRRRVEPESPTPTRFLTNDYNKRKAATARFPPKITARHLRVAMRRYEQVVQNACTAVETSCASCGEFMAKAESAWIPVDDDRLCSMKSPEGLVQLDSCSIMDGAYQFCKTCFNVFTGGRIPKFSALNAVNVTMCQHYPAELEDLTLMEEYAIARSHPIGTILKLKPNGLVNPTAFPTLLH